MQWLLWLLVLQVSVSLHSLSPDLHPEFGMAVVSHWKSSLSARRQASLPRICEVAQHVGVMPLSISQVRKQNSKVKAIAQIYVQPQRWAYQCAFKMTGAWGHG